MAKSCLQRLETRSSAWTACATGLAESSETVMHQKAFVLLFPSVTTPRTRQFLTKKRQRDNRFTPRAAARRFCEAQTVAPQDFRRFYLLLVVTKTHRNTPAISARLITVCHGHEELSLTIHGRLADRSDSWVCGAYSKRRERRHGVWTQRVSLSSGQSQAHGRLYTACSNLSYLSRSSG